MTIAFLAMLCAQSVAAQAIRVHAWTDKPQYETGEKGILKISVLNELDEPIEIHNITIEYPWFRYDAAKDEGEWVGNETFKGEPIAILASKGGDYYEEVDFPVPSDGKAIMGDTIHIVVGTSKEIIVEEVPLLIATPSWPMSIVDLDMWMTSLTVVIVICTIILAIVVFLSTRKTRAPRLVAPPPPPPRKAKS